MLASMIFRKEPFFHGQDNYDQVSKGTTIGELSGRKESLDFLNEGIKVALISSVLIM